MKNRTPTLIGIALFLTFHLSVSFVSAATAYVRLGGSGNGSSWALASGDVQQAITSVANAGGGQVWIAAGTYYPNSWPNGGSAAREVHFAMRNGVSIMGGFPNSGNPGLADRNPAANATVLSGDIGTLGNSADNAYHVFYHPSGTGLNATARLSGVTITGGIANGADTHESGGGFYCDGGSAVIAKCKIIGNAATGAGGGLHLSYYSSLNMVNCVIAGNGSEFIGGGVHVDDYSSASIANCLFISNTCTIGSALSTKGVATYTNCTFAMNNGYSSTVYHSGGATGLNNCIVWGNGSYWPVDDVSGGLAVNYSIIEGDWPGTGNLAVDPLFTNAADPDGPDNQWPTADDGLRLAAGSPALNSGNNSYLTPDVSDLDEDGNTSEPLPLDLAMQPRIRSSTVDRGAYEISPICYVRPGASGNGSSWVDATGNLQQAIDACASSGNSQVWVAAGTYKPSSFPNGGSAAREVHFSMRNGVAIYGGFPGTGNPGFPDRNPATYPTILSGDLGTSGAAGDNAYHVFFHPASIGLNASARLDGVTITAANGDGPDAHQYGGGMFNQTCSPTLVGCTFLNNRTTFQAGALYMSGSTSRVTNCIFSGNVADTGVSGVDQGGAIYVYQSSPQITNCVFHGNSADQGSAVFAYSGGSTALNNCTITGNSGRAVHVASSTVTIYNSILWGDSPGELLGNVIWSYSLIQGFPGGTGNFSADPQFANAADPDGPDNIWGTADDGLRLSVNSPALNAGSLALLPVDGSDLDRDENVAELLPLDVLLSPRSIGGLPELGAYEHVPSGMSLAYWRSLQFSGAVRSNSGQEATVWGNFADPDKDGIANCGEYILLSNPNQFNSPLSNVGIVNFFGGKWMRFQYTRALDRPGVSVFTETCSDLATGPWTRGGYFSSVVSGTATTETHEILVPALPQHGFARLAFTVD